MTSTSTHSVAQWRFRAKTHLRLVTEPPMGRGLASPLAEPVPGDVVLQPPGGDAAGSRGAVVAPSHGRADGLERPLKALGRQDLPACDFEVIMVNDASLDGTLL